MARNQSGCPIDHNNEQQEKSGCPVDHSKESSSFSFNPVSWFSSSKSGPSLDVPRKTGECPVKQNSFPDSCPVKHDGKNPFSLPPSLEESARHAQSVHPDQRIPLSTHRVVSTIPRADELREEQAAPHQPSEGHKWVYPSEQQFYNAMKRKGWNGVDEATMPLVVRIHNAVNEKGWQHVRRWERELHDNHEPRLVRFLGRPQDMSPRAFLNSFVLMKSAPFDRHDWYVDRGDGQEPRRYVIDFYNGEDGSNRGQNMISSALQSFRGTKPEDAGLPPRPPAMYLDVRPALDSPDAVMDRVKMFFVDSFPGLYAAFGSPSAINPSGSDLRNGTHTQSQAKPQE